MINLLPPKRLLEIKIARSNLVLRRYVELTMLSLTFLAATIFVAHHFFTVQQNNIQRTVDLQQQKIAELEPVQKQAEELSATVNTISGLLSRNVKFSDMLTQIGGVMPAGSVLTGLQFSIEDAESPLVVSAQVDNEQKAAILRNNLANSKLFSRADIKSITKIEEKSTTSTQTIAPTPTTTTTTETTTVPVLTPTTPTVPPSPYKFTTVINAYFKDGILGAKQ